MASLGERRGPYSLDVVKVRHRGVTVTTIVNSPVFDSIIKNMKSAYDYEVGFIPEQVKHRPDLISNDFYGSPKNWWLLMLVNNITDPFEGFKTKERIVIPKVR
tara:strand:+ start:832 stop:1140 length:309 start_codon:yes stop_codon:yes gene_type:complete